MPDGQSREDLDYLISEIAMKYVMENAKKQGSDRKRLLLHCRAGIGRTGTTIALINAMISIQEQKNQGVKDPIISIFSIVRRLRE